MIARHKMTVHAQCPVDPRTTDYYSVVFEREKLLHVELLRMFLDEVRGEALYQEDLTQHLANKACCRVTTVGLHGTTETTVTCEART